MNTSGCCCVNFGAFLSVTWLDLVASLVCSAKSRFGVVMCFFDTTELSNERRFPCSGVYMICTRGSPLLSGMTRSQVILAFCPWVVFLVLALSWCGNVVFD